MPKIPKALLIMSALMSPEDLAKSFKFAEQADHMHGVNEVKYCDTCDEEMILAPNQKGDEEAFYICNNMFCNPLKRDD